VLDVAAEDGGRLLDVTPEEKHNGAYTRHGQDKIRQPHAFASHSTQGLPFLWGIRHLHKGYTILMFLQFQPFDLK